MSQISNFARDFFYSQQMLSIDGLCELKVKGLFDIDIVNFKTFFLRNV